jgi:hypothetical protein
MEIGNSDTSDKDTQVTSISATKRLLDREGRTWRALPFESTWLAATMTNRGRMMQAISPPLVRHPPFLLNFSTNGPQLELKARVCIVYMQNRGMLVLACILCPVHDHMIDLDLQCNYTEVIKRECEGLSSKELGDKYYNHIDTIMEHVNSKISMIEKELREIEQLKTGSQGSESGPNPPTSKEAGTVKVPTDKDVAELREREKKLRGIASELAMFKRDSSPSALLCDKVNEILSRLDKIIKKHFTGRKVEFSTSGEDATDYSTEDTLFSKQFNILYTKALMLAERVGREQTAGAPPGSTEMFSLW